MVTKNLFKSNSKSSAVRVEPTNTVNDAGGTAYSLSDKAALSQLALTGCFNGTYYCSDEDQLKKVIELSSKCDTPFLAKLAVYARKQGLMKDMPAFLAAVLANRDTTLLAKIFNQVIDNPKMARNFAQIIRSGQTKRKSFGTRPKKLLQAYLENLTDEQLFNANVGNDPSLPDLIRMVRPKPVTKQRSALYAYLLGKKYNEADLLPLAVAFEKFKKDMSGPIPPVQFQMLTALPLTSQHWKEIATNATWTQLRMNLNTFLRHDVFKDAKMVDLVAKKLSDPELVRKSRVFPYQLFTAYNNMDPAMPSKITTALQKAAEVALENVPDLDGQVYIFPDVSGSMSSPVTGNRGSVTTKTRCIDVAALVSAAVLRKNPEAVVLPFDTKVHSAKLNPLDSIVTNATKLASYGGGGTACALPLAKLNAEKAKAEVLIYVSDSESWIRSDPSWNFRNSGTDVMNEWKIFKARNPRAKLICIDVIPNTTSQVNADKDILQIGGFNDSIFEVISKFVENGNDKDMWVSMIESITLE